ncbi:uncharacterized protein LOC121380137 [Gigantopelta aegis]|uniref:uncharacterized protein LOC121380137 n=1 Tax=Gigantopelta aegis TaxID=1735272 RepID=UPI001B888BB6|nr:uncharacterized protein LOC121380137 [Gigantopelta aegis]XP_041364853.1 uncharacterized protein LOC121380137 [Gigantopelta aegis]XP_041364854.1 uncharacterized protein LOC121380137 [Gigantopelta aegis]XP_041364855.1 uncharacterized protein LOC121380137 [Gigantopelta aegis]
MQRLSVCKWRPLLLFIVLIVGVLLILHFWSMKIADNNGLAAWSRTLQLIEDDMSSSQTQSNHCGCTVLVRRDAKWQDKKLGCPRKDTTVRVYLKTPAGSVPMYVYPKITDIWVSKSIIEKNEWEPKLTKIVTDIMSRDVTLDFLDVGSNVGAYTMTLAKMGRRVTAIEALPLTAKLLCKSVQDAKFPKPVPVIINNVLSNKRSQFLFRFDPNNIGGTYVVESENKSAILKNAVDSILLDDVLEIFRPKNLFIKMDTQRHELKILEGAKQFFRDVNVKYILMEMMFITKDDFVRASQVIQFLTNQNMNPFMPNNLDVPVDSDILIKSTREQNILWKKS